MQILMFNMFLLILLFNFFLTLRSVILKRKVESSCLFCGICAYNGGVPADPNFIKMIMMFNMERGEDGTGWAVNNIVKKDTEKVSKFIQQNKLITSPEDENFTIIAHARKSSSGTKNNKELVHPFSIYKNNVEKAKPDLILAMNGTMNNVSLFASTFEVEYKEYTNSDTQILSKVMANLGEKEYIKAIEGYDGTATLVFFNPRYSNTLMVYRDIARPLHMWQKSPNEIYISSIEEPFFSLGATKEEIFTFESEFLYRLHKGVVKKKEKVNRSPIRPKSSVYDNRNYSNYPATNYNNFRKNQYEADIVSVVKNNKKFNIHEFLKNSNPHKGKAGNIVYTIMEKYYRTGHLLQGMYIINNQGEIKEPKDLEAVKNDNKEGLKKYYFINGYLCKNEGSYNSLIKKCSDKKDFEIEIFRSQYLSSLCEYFEYPLTTIVSNEQKWILNKEWSNKLTTVNCKISLDMFLSPYIFKLNYKGQVTGTTKKDVCDLEEGGVIEKKLEETELKEDIIKELNKRVNLTIQNTELIRIIKESTKSNGKSNYFYTILRNTVYKENPCEQLREHFYNNLIQELRNFNIIDIVENENLKKLAKDESYSSVIFLDEVDKKVSLLQDKLQNNKEEINANLSTAEKLKLLDDIGTKLTEEDIINSIKKTNSLYNKESFKNDLADSTYTNFNDFMTAWVNTYNSAEIRLFLEAVALCFLELAHITINETLDLFDCEAHILKSRLDKIWFEYVELFNTNDAVNKAKDIINNNEENVEDSSTPDDYENMCKDDADNLYGIIVSKIDEIETVDEVDRTPYVKKMLIEFKSIKSWFEKQLIEKKDEHK